jgi:phospholipid/cholesterol/gamma-HCH transport system substrate-binding protein
MGKAVTSTSRDERVNAGRRETRLHPKWWALILLTVIAVFVAVTTGMFTDSFRSYVPVTLTSDRSGLAMEEGAKVKLRGVQVGRVATVSHRPDAVSLGLLIDSGEIRYIPRNVSAQIKATTAFGAKYVELELPGDPSPERLTAGAVLRSINVSTEVNTVFQNLVTLLDQVDPAKLNGVVSAIADALRGQGPAIGQATTDANQVLSALNARSDTVRRDLRSLKGFSAAYGDAAVDILAILNSATTTSATITSHSAGLEKLLLGAVDLGRSGTDLLESTKDTLIHAINGAAPTTALLMKYSPEYTCLLLGAKLANDWGLPAIGGNGSTAILDAGFTWGADAYRYPDNLPIVAAKGGPGGKPGCGSLPDATKNYPVRQLVTNTGWGTGLDIRPNLGIAHPFWIDYLPVTRAVPQPPSVRLAGPPAIGPIPYPGAPPFGAPLYGPDGTPLYPPPPPGPPSP